MKKWWQFWKKEQPIPTREPKRLPIPEEHLERIFVLSDAYSSAPANADRLARHQLWKTVANIHPEVKTGKWHLSHKTFGIDVVETVE